MTRSIPDRSKSPAALLAALLLVAACGGSAAPTASPTASPSAEPSATATPLALVKQPIPGLVTNTVTFTGLELTVLEAFISNESPRDYADKVAQPTPLETSHLFVSLSGKNTTRHRPDLAVDQFSLVLADGTAIEATDLFGRGDDFLTPDPSAAAEGFLAFEVEPTVDVSGASLRIGKAPDRSALLALTGPQPSPDYPIRLTAKGEAHGTGVTNGSALLYTLLGGTLGVDNPLEDPNYDTGWRANQDELFLVLDIRILMESGSVEGTFKDQFRLLVGGVPRAPWNSPPGGSIGPGAAVDTKVGWLIPADAAEVVLQVGDPAKDPGAIKIALPKA